MMMYRFDAFNMEGILEASCDLHAETDQEARDIANGLVLENEFQNIEAWNVFGLVCRVARTNRP